MGAISNVLYSAVKYALVLKHRLQSYYPCFFEYIYRIDTGLGVVVDENCVRSKLCTHDVFYMISAWNCDTSRYHKFLLHGRLIKADIGNDSWVSMSTRDIIKLLVSRYDENSTVNSNILVITINDKDVTELFADMRSSLSVQHNVTAAAIVLAHQYLEYGHPPPYTATGTTFHAFALKTMLENMSPEGVLNANINSDADGTTIAGEGRNRAGPSDGATGEERRVGGDGDDGGGEVSEPKSDGEGCCSLQCVGHEDRSAAVGRCGGTVGTVWTGWDSRVTIVDYNLNESQCSGHTVLFP